jgi:16S rRNA C967 or C1407 C5-methylase (RsmB/RsmF family)
VLASDFSSEAEFQEWLLSVQSHLNTSFRINGSYPNYEKIKYLFKTSKYIQNCLDHAADGVSQEELDEYKKRYGTDLKKVTVESVPWYPDELVFQLNASREGLRKSETLKNLHKMIQAASECGMVIRQELVSMLPPLFLELKSSDLVLDMCAAPGSKTSQILEMLSIEFEKNRGKVPQEGLDEVKGGVVANDMSLNRASMLAHRVKLINTIGMAVINHEGQKIPEIKDSQGNSVLYDKVMVDVPCSGDGAIRKLPNRWKVWNCKDGQDLHHI